MDDQGIIDLYFARSEDAIGETDRKYGSFCRRIATNILSLREDAEECVSDVYHAAWNAMPPQRPGSLRSFLGVLTRNLSIARWRADHAKKRFSGGDVLLSELEECLPGPRDTEAEAERRLLTQAITAWLNRQKPEDRALFLRRYWYGDPVKTLAGELGFSENRTAQRLRRLRESLRQALEEGDFTL